MPTARQLQPAMNAQENTSAAGSGHGVFQPVDTQTQATNSSGITELVLTQHSPDAQMLLLPMLAHLSRNAERWITWIADAPVDREVLASYGVETGKVRIIRSNCEESTRWILWEALNTGTSHTVIASLDELSESVFSHLESAAQAGKSRALLIRYR